MILRTKSSLNHVSRPIQLITEETKANDFTMWKCEANSLLHVIRGCLEATCIIILKPTRAYSNLKINYNSSMYLNLNTYWNPHLQCFLTLMQFRPACFKGNKSWVKWISSTGIHSSIDMSFTRWKLHFRDWYVNVKFSKKIENFWLKIWKQRASQVMSNHSKYLVYKLSNLDQDQQSLKIRFWSLSY